MQYRTIILVLLLLWSSKILICQINDSQSLIASSKQYYRSLKVFSVIVNVQSKTSLSQDTILWQYRCFIDNNSRNRIFLAKSNGIFISDSKEYLLYLDTYQFENVKNSDKKFNAYHQRYVYYPFVEVDNFFDNFKTQQLFFKETDTSYLLVNPIFKYEFRKTNNSLKSITKIMYEKLGNGISYEKTIFSDCVENDTEIAEQINNMLAITGSKENEKKNNANADFKNPVSFDLSVLKKSSLRIKNDKGEKVEGKTIFFDFFYKDCYPCVKSFPLVEKLFEERDADFLIIGVDDKLSDTLNIDQYLEKYNIRYPVIVGSVALEMSKSLKVEIWPTFVIVDSSGRVLDYRAGFSEAFFRRVEKKYLKKRS